MTPTRPAPAMDRPPVARVPQPAAWRRAVRVRGRVVAWQPKGDPVPACAPGGCEGAAPARRTAATFRHAAFPINVSAGPVDTGDGLQGAHAWASR